MPRSGLLSVTCALATAAPLGSVTVPIIEAESCPQAASERDRQRPSQSTRDFIDTSKYFFNHPKTAGTSSNQNPCSVLTSRGAVQCAYPSGKSCFASTRRTGRGENLTVFIEGPGKSEMAFCMKAFIKTNQWLKYCGRSTTGVKKKRRKIMPTSFLNDRANSGF